MLGRTADSSGRIYGEEGNPKSAEAPFKIEHGISRECAYHYGLLDPKDPY